mmetsp:Transcript_25181/g.63925  ORF Transcript_25181/g.63925 Transcript_25181/m.63925 type:complete len:373 (+) Transcript_25181:228-1346(+)
MHPSPSNGVCPCVEGVEGPLCFVQLEVPIPLFLVGLLQIGDELLLPWLAQPHEPPPAVTWSFGLRLRLAHDRLGDLAREAKLRATLVVSQLPLGTQQAAVAALAHAAHGPGRGREQEAGVCAVGPLHRGARQVVPDPGPVPAKLLRDEARLGVVLDGGQVRSLRQAFLLRHQPRNLVGVGPVAGLLPVRPRQRALAGLEAHRQRIDPRHHVGHSAIGDDVEAHDVVLLDEAAWLPVELADLPDPFHAEGRGGDLAAGTALDEEARPLAPRSCLSGALAAGGRNRARGGGRHADLEDLLALLLPLAAGQPAAFFRQLQAAFLELLLHPRATVWVAAEVGGLRDQCAVAQVHLLAHLARRVVALGVGDGRADGA